MLCCTQTLGGSVILKPHPYFGALFCVMASGQEEPRRLEDQVSGMLTKVSSTIVLR